MGSTDSERSISSGISIPQWMKSKISDRYDIEETFSPPTHDETFFYIRYPRSKPAQQQQDDSNYRPISEVFEEKPVKRDFSKHTQPCKDFIPEANTTEKSSSQPLGPIQMQSRVNKSQGTDDGYAGEAAACGKSVVQVAQQMIADNMLTLRRNEATIPPKERMRRNSKSLPASPLSSPNVSPKLHRKNQGDLTTNRYFTGVFGVPAQYPGSWILSGVLGQRDITTQQSNIQKATSEKCSEDERKENVRRNKSTSSLAPIITEGSKDDDQSSSDGESSPGLTKKEMVFRAKPSELREMNFLSPTSM